MSEKITTVTLRAEHLWMKSGFADGWLLGDLFCELFASDQIAPHLRETFGSTEFLIKCVRACLIPILPREIPIEEWTSHNPIRAVGWEAETCPPDLVDIEITVELGVLKAMAVDTYALSKWARMSDGERRDFIIKNSPRREGVGLYLAVQA